MRNQIRTILLPLGDVVMLMVSFFVMLVMAFPGNVSEEIIESHFTPFIIVFCIWIFVFLLFNLYDFQSVKPTIPNLRKIGVASIVALASSAILFYLIPFFGITPKTNLVIFSVVFVLLFIVWRRIFYNIFSSHFRKGLALLIDPKKDSESFEKIKNYIESTPQSGFFIFGTYASFQEFMFVKDKGQIDTIIVSKNLLKEQKDLISIYSTVKNILDLRHAYESILGKIPVDSIDETWFLHNVQSTNNPFYNLISKMINILTALFVLVVTLPFLIIVALLIKLTDHGSIFYTQTRVGKGGKNFKLYKFRSMVMDSETNGPVWANKNDSRMTAIGKIIRKLHIDELPQMINILRGELALVGPRPERPEFVSKLESTIPHYEFRHIIHPGFTGWAQIKYRYANSVEDSKEKLEYDLYYIKNRNFFIDLGIILRTIQIIFTH